MKNKQIIFDFDGVLMDTFKEAALTAFNTATGRFLVNLEDLPPFYITNFSKGKSKCHNAFAMVANAMQSLGSQYKQRANFKNKEEIRDKFFANRIRFAEEFKDQWFALNSPFETIWDFYKKHHNHFLILSSKNKDSIIALCNHFGLEIDPSRIYSASDTGSKVEKFEEIKAKLPNTEFTIIEDCLDHLLKLDADHKVLARWGYIDDDQRSAAMANLMDVWTEEQLVEKLSKDLSA